MHERALVLDQEQRDNKESPHVQKILNDFIQAWPAQFNTHTHTCT